jgi:hypothetical protein
MFGIELGESETTFVIAYVGLIVVALWVAIVVWAYRDMRARSRDTIVQIFVGLMVAVLTLPGFLIYLFLRPRETLSEAYERSLEEEALLQEIEEKPSCPGCGQRVEASWQACPNCHTRLKKSCIACRNLLELSWNLCPFCATSQGGYTDVDVAPYTKPANVPEQRVSLTRRENPPVGAESSAPIEFVDDEY